MNVILLLCEWRALPYSDKLEALRQVRELARETVSQLTEEPPTGWTNFLRDVIGDRWGSAAASAWETVSCEDTLPDGLDPREVTFAAIAWEVWLDRQPTEPTPDA